MAFQSVPPPEVVARTYRVSFNALILVAMMTLSHLAGQQSGDPAPGSIEGVVVDAGTGAPRPGLARSRKLT